MFGKKKKETKQKALLTSFDLMQTKTVLSSEELLDLCDVVLGGRALLANFERIPVSDANRMLAFLSGAVYALNGQVHQTGPHTLYSGIIIESLSQDKTF
jgi:hypothetical protein